MTHLCDDIYQTIENVCDDFLFKKHSKFSLFKYLSSENVTRKQALELIDSACFANLKMEVNHLQLALDGDPLYKEAYSNFTKPEMRLFQSLMSSMIDDLSKYLDTKKIVRKKKPVTPEKQVKGLKYLTDPYTLKNDVYTSIDPKTIPGSNLLVVFNTKYNELCVYKGKKLSVKGTTLFDFDTKTSWSKRLRKPEDFLNKINKNSIDNIKNQLTTKEKVPTGRINEHCILLRVY